MLKINNKINFINTLKSKDITVGTFYNKNNLAALRIRDNNTVIEETDKAILTVRNLSVNNFRIADNKMLVDVRVDLNYYYKVFDRYTGLEDNMNYYNFEFSMTNEGINVDKLRETISLNKDNLAITGEINLITQDITFLNVEGLLRLIHEEEQHRKEFNSVMEIDNLIRSKITDTYFNGIKISISSNCVVKYIDNEVVITTRALCLEKGYKLVHIEFDNLYND
ncbi:hypothetical protein KPH14_000855 [Odynerus spinipes]|uniref:Uncharacterized protein n=1 Tax=Odynerus spinipes TaxID=1348599 RepID=A0AAD9RDC5_9HYME|nr:hypothetical protein KPH14_000855 [Odynerus spinipes]